MTKKPNLKAVPSNEAQSKSAKAINTLAKSIGTRASKLQTDIHTVGLMTLQHAMDFGDARPIVVVMDNLPKGQRREAFYEWVKTYSPIRWNEKTKNCGLLKEDQKGFAPFDIPAAMSNPYYDQEERISFKAKPLDFATPIKQAMTKAYTVLAFREMGLDDSDLDLTEGYDPDVELKRMAEACASLGIDLPDVDTGKVADKAAELANQLAA